MDIITSFQHLGIERTKDKTVIKKAYSSLVKTYHPEEHPEQWKILYQAYKNALKYADAMQSQSNDKQKYEKKDRNLDEAISNSHELFFNENTISEEQNEYHSIFQNLESNLEQDMLYKKNHIQHIIANIKEKTTFVRKEEWLQLFSDESYYACREDEEVIYAIMSLIKEKKYFFSSVPLIYEHLIELKTYFSHTEKAKLINSVKDTINIIEKRWMLTQRNRSLLNKKRRLWGMWQNFWNLPFLYYVILCVVLSLAIGMQIPSYERIQGISILLILSFFVILIGKNIRDDLWKEDKRRGKKYFGEKHIKYKDMEYYQKIPVWFSCIILLSVPVWLLADLIGGGSKENPKLILENGRFTSQLVFQANEQKDVLERKNYIISYKFVLVNEDKEDEVMLMMKESEFEEYQEYLEQGDDICLEGYEKYVSSSDYVQDLTAYSYLEMEAMLKNQINFLDTAQVWLNRDVFYVVNVDSR